MNSTVNRSTFVTVVAWIFAVLSGFATVISMMQNITAHFQLFFFAFLIGSTLTLASSIGLLKRKNWARQIFVCLMVLGIVWNLGGLVLRFAMFSAMQDRFGHPDMEVFFIAMSAVSILFALGFSGLFGWIVKRLLSPAIAAEFKQ